MENREYKKHMNALAQRAMFMSIESLQAGIVEDWNDPKWPSMLFDGMNKALEKKMGKRAYAQWFDNLPVKNEVQA